METLKICFAKVENTRTLDRKIVDILNSFLSQKKKLVNEFYFCHCYKGETSIFYSIDLIKR